MMSDLVKQLREGDEFERYYAGPEAADRIEKLEAELAYYKGFHDDIRAIGTYAIMPLKSQEPKQSYDVFRQQQERIAELEGQIKIDALQYLSDVGEMQDKIADLNATLNQIPDYAYNAGMLKGILVGIVDWAYHQEDKPEWLDGAEGILRKVKDD